MNTETNYRTPYTVHRTLQKKLRFFSLIELLIVLAIIGALTALILPSFNLDEVSKAGDVNQTVNAKEIRTIQKAFLNFYDDVVPLDPQLEDFAKYGLAPLMENVKAGQSGDWFMRWDANRHKGWRDPYLSPEGREGIDATKTDGQSTSGSTQIPVVYNSYGDFYRVMIPKKKDTSTTANAKYLCLVDSGANGVVDSLNADKTTLEVDIDTGEIIPNSIKGDDKVIRLLPFN